MSVAKSKVVFLGNSSVGKTSILYRMKIDAFKTDQDSTIGCEFFAKEIHTNEGSIKLLLWDTAGQEVFRTFTKNFLRGAKLVVIVYDISSIQTFNDIKDWLHEVEMGTNKSPVVVVGNKADLDNMLDIDPRDITNTLKKYYQNIYYFGNVSCKTGYNVKELFTFIGELLLKNEDHSLSYDDDIVSLDYKKKGLEKKENYCCNV